MPNDEKITISTSANILLLRDFLQQISHISFSFSKLNQTYPIDTLSEKGGKEIIEAYKSLLERAERIIEESKR
jgi:hypothetical protein